MPVILDSIVMEVLIIRRQVPLRKFVVTHKHTSGQVGDGREDLHRSRSVKVDFEALSCAYAVPFQEETEYEQ
jgi:hypothetical protein